LSNPHGQVNGVEKIKHEPLSEAGNTEKVDDEGYTGVALEDETQEEKDEHATPEFLTPIAGKMTGSMEEFEHIQGVEESFSEEVRECLKDSLSCYQTCTETLTRCLRMGGEHARQEHLNLLMDCAKICNLNADFILRNSAYYPQTCGITADICDECGDSCDRFNDDFMKECAAVCRRCAESCREIAR